MKRIFYVLIAGAAVSGIMAVASVNAGAPGKSVGAKINASGADQSAAVVGNSAVSKAAK